MVQEFATIPDRPLPTNIRFGLQKMCIPSFESQGIPELFAQRGFFDRSIRYRYCMPNRCWIERGDPLIQVRFIVYSHESSPRGLFSRSDPTWKTQFTLSSPISGLLIDATQTYCGFYSDTPYATSSGSALAYGYENIWPVLLVPQDEPPADNYHVSSFFHNVGTLLVEVLPRLLQSTPKGHIRLKEAMAEFSNEEELARSLELVKSYQRPKTGESIISQITRDDKNILEHVQQLRKQDHDLRDRLVHIVHFFERGSS